MTLIILNYEPCTYLLGKMLQSKMFTCATHEIHSRRDYEAKQYIRPSWALCQHKYRVRTKSATLPIIYRAVMSATFDIPKLIDLARLTSWLHLIDIFNCTKVITLHLPQKGLYLVLTYVLRYETKDQTRISCRLSLVWPWIIKLIIQSNRLE